MPSSIPVYYGLDDTDRKKLLQEVEKAYSVTPAESESSEQAPDTDEAPATAVDIEPAQGLLGLDIEIYKQINGALKAGKRHLMFYGPPGTGKTTLAQYVAGKLHDSWTMITGSSDWSSQDVIGGYQPVGNGQIQFVPGVLLQKFDRPLIIDEFNRCDIDKVIGPLFTVLSDQPTSLPYRVDTTKADSPFYRILPRPVSNPQEHEFAPRGGWRLIATINTADKAALYQMSFALSRRFAWIFIDVPKDLQAFVVEYAKLAHLAAAEATPSGTVPLAAIWGIVNKVRRVGPAPIIDMANTLRQMEPSIDLLSPANGEAATHYVHVFSMYLTPLLDGALLSELNALSLGVCQILGVAPDSTIGSEFSERLASIAL